MLELMVVMSVLLVALLGMSRALTSSMALTGVNRETALATDAGREMIEVLSGVEDFDKVFALYNTNPEDDPEGPGSAPGPGFTVEGLHPAADDLDGTVGQILFPVDPSGELLLEDPGMESPWIPRDLNGNGLIDAAPQNTDYRLLPVLLRLRWEGSSGVRTLEVRTLIADR